VQLVTRNGDHPDTYGLASQATGELERIRRQMRANLALVSGSSPARVPILSHLRAVDAELARRADDQVVDEE
jgi:hypothetical protein